MTREEILERIREILSDSFDLSPADITSESTLYEELDLDSIDAIDIFVQLREVTGRRPDPAEAREIRTVDELITFVEKEIARGPESPAEVVAGGPPPEAPARTGSDDS